VSIAVAEGTRRARILAHLAGHSDLTAFELGRAIGSSPASLYRLLQSMERRAQVIRRTEWRAGMGRDVSLWSIAPPGTEPPPRPALPPKVVAARRLAWRTEQRIRRARTAGRARILPPMGVCSPADAPLFFGAEGEAPEVRAEREAQAIAICLTCPARSACLAYAQQTGQVSGVWGGVSLEPSPAKGREVS
jgi:WhiB family redox-sensing transcriptional regulator